MSPTTISCVHFIHHQFPMKSAVRPCPGSAVSAVRQGHRLPNSAERRGSSHRYSSHLPSVLSITTRTYRALCHPPASGEDPAEQSPFSSLTYNPMHPQWNELASGLNEEGGQSWAMHGLMLGRAAALASLREALWPPFSGSPLCQRRMPKSETSASDAASSSNHATRPRKVRAAVALSSFALRCPSSAQGISAANRPARPAPAAVSVAATMPAIGTRGSAGCRSPPHPLVSISAEPSVCRSEGSPTQYSATGGALVASAASLPRVLTIDESTSGGDGAFEIFSAFSTHKGHGLPGHES